MWLVQCLCKITIQYYLWGVCSMSHLRCTLGSISRWPLCYHILFQPCVYCSLTLPHSPTADAGICCLISLIGLMHCGESSGLMGRQRMRGQNQELNPSRGSLLVWRPDIDAEVYMWERRGRGSYSPEVGLERIGMTRKTSQERLSHLLIRWTRRKPKGEGWGYLKYLWHNSLKVRDVGAWGFRTTEWFL